MLRLCPTFKKRMNCVICEIVFFRNRNLHIRNYRNFRNPFYNPAFSAFRSIVSDAVIPVIARLKFTWINFDAFKRTNLIDTFVSVLTRSGTRTFIDVIASYFDIFLGAVKSMIARVFFAKIFENTLKTTR